jgi:hypothetical protein
VPVALSSEAKWLGHEAHHNLYIMPIVTMTAVYTSKPPLAFMACAGTTLPLQLTAMELHLDCNNQPLHWCTTCVVNVYNQCLRVRRQVATLLNLNPAECFQTGSLPFSTYTYNASNLKIKYIAMLLVLNTTSYCTTNLWQMVGFHLKY